MSNRSRSTFVAPEVNFKNRQMMLELYSDWSNYHEIIDFIDSHYLWYLRIEHNKDVWDEEDFKNKGQYMTEHGYQVGDLKKVHTHCVVRFQNARFRQTVCKELNIEPQFVQPVRSYRGALEYLLHLNNYDKERYSIDDTVGSLRLDLQKFINDSVSIEDRSNEIIEIIMSHPHMTTIDLLKEVNKRGLYSVYRQGYSVYKDILTDHNMGIF